MFLANNMIHLPFKARLKLALPCDIKYMRSPPTDFRIVSEMRARTPPPDLPVLGHLFIYEIRGPSEWRANVGCGGSRGGSLLRVSKCNFILHKILWFLLLPYINKLRTEHESKTHNLRISELNMHRNF